MSTTEREWVLDHQQIDEIASNEVERWDEHREEARECVVEICEIVRDIYEEVRTKDLERIKELEEALAELYKAPKVLTEDAAKDEALKRYGPALYKPGDPRHDMQSTIVFYACYEWLRDNGYLAPAAGMTVEETDAIIDSIVSIASKHYKGYVFQGQGVGVPTTMMRNDLRACLTAAINKKQ